MYTAAHVLKAKQDPALGVGAVRAGTGRAQHRPPPPLNGPLATWRAKTSSWASACNSTSQKRLVLSCNYATLISREIPLGPRVQLNVSYVSTNGAGMDRSLPFRSSWGGQDGGGRAWGGHRLTQSKVCVPGRVRGTCSWRPRAEVEEWWVWGLSREAGEIRKEKLT